MIHDGDLGGTNRLSYADLPNVGTFYYRVSKIMFITLTIHFIWKNFRYWKSVKLTLMNTTFLKIFFGVWWGALKAAFYHQPQVLLCCFPWSDRLAVFVYFIWRGGKYSIFGPTHLCIFIGCSLYVPPEQGWIGNPGIWGRCSDQLSYRAKTMLTSRKCLPNIQIWMTSLSVLRQKCSFIKRIASSACNSFTWGLFLEVTMVLL